MIQYAKGDLIKTVKKGVILHQCNCFGVMGAGFALQLKKTYPKNFSTYEGYCESYKDHRDKLLGTALLTSFENDNQLIICNIFGQFSTGGRKATSYDALDQIFYDIYTSSSNDKWNHHIHMPMIGSGLGGGDWNVISSIIESHLPEDKLVTVWKL